MLSLSSLLGAGSFRWTAFGCDLFQSDRLEIQGGLYSVEKRLVDAGWVQQEHILVQSPIAQKNSSICSMTQGRQTVRLIDQAGIIKQDRVKQKSCLL